MLIRLSTSDIFGILSLASQSSSGLSNVLPLLKESFKIDNAICITKSLPIISGIKLVIVIKAEQESGNLELNITKATVAGLSIFGVVRVEAAKLIIKLLSPYVKIWKNSRGNLSLSLPNVRFNKAEIVGDTISLDLSLS